MKVFILHAGYSCFHYQYYSRE